MTQLSWRIWPKNFIPATCIAVKFKIILPLNFDFQSFNFCQKIFKFFESLKIIFLFYYLFFIFDDWILLFTKKKTNFQQNSFFYLKIQSSKYSFLYFLFLYCVCFLLFAFARHLLNIYFNFDFCFSAAFGTFCILLFYHSVFLQFF